MEMCTQGMAWDLLYVLQMSKPWTFQELATKAHDMDTTRNWIFNDHFLTTKSNIRC